MCGLIRKLLDHRSGAISVEYSLAAGLVGVAAALAFAALGDALDHMYETTTVVTGETQSVSNQPVPEG
jgi:Flp pilus assembly pilin Flp